VVSQHGVRSVIDAPGVVIEHVAVAGRSFIATGWCTGEVSGGLVHCDRAGTQPVMITGDLDLAKPPHARTFARDGDLHHHVEHDMRGAIDDDGTTVIVASARRPQTIDGTTVSSSCARFAFAASWTRDGGLRFARALGDCKSSVASAHTRNGGCGGDADKTIAIYEVGAFDVAWIEHRPVVALDVHKCDYAENIELPIRFDDEPVVSVWGQAGLVATLDDRGRIVRRVPLQFSSAPERAGQPDASLTNGGGVARIALAASPSRNWIVIEHRGTIDVGGHVFARATALVDHAAERLQDPTCTLDKVRAPPDVATLLRYHREGHYPPDYRCRQAVEAEAAIAVVPF
jgi:hypothetical protein